MYATIDAASNNIPTTFGSGAGSLILDGAPSGGQLAVINTTTSDIVFTVTSKPSAVPDDSTAVNPAQYLVPAAPSGGTVANTHDYMAISKGDRIFIKSPGGTTSSGKVHVIVW